MGEISRLKSFELRAAASTLAKLADEAEREEHATRITSGSLTRQKSQLFQIEARAGEYTEIALNTLNARRMRQRYFPKEILGEPAWDMALDLFVNYFINKRVSITSICIASNSPPTTALRYLNALEEANLVNRHSSDFDHRVRYVTLTPKGILAVAQCLQVDRSAGAAADLFARS